jgi:hypothetical protein
MISAKVSLMLGSYFSHAIKNCALSEVPLRYIFFLLSDI